jgi:hypothetical protein
LSRLLDYHHVHQILRHGDIFSHLFLQRNVLRGRPTHCVHRPVFLNLFRLCHNIYLRAGQSCMGLHSKGEVLPNCDFLLRQFVIQHCDIFIAVNLYLYHPYEP